jgi:hypothetical protein
MVTVTRGSNQRRFRRSEQNSDNSSARKWQMKIYDLAFGQGD